jgi:hypothetical protein
MPFKGRANRLYCSKACKTQVNNAKTASLRKDYRYYARIMEHNIRVFETYQKKFGKFRAYVAKDNLRQLGFNIHGPFIINRVGQFVVGKYCLKDVGLWYKVEEQTNLSMAFMDI